MLCRYGFLSIWEHYYYSHGLKERVYLDGKLEGSVELLDGSLTVGPDARIRANLRARSIVIQGLVDGNMYGLERVELKKSAIFVGDILHASYRHRRWRSLRRKRADP